MEKLKAKLKKQGGFTLIEMLIVVAIIAILIAVSIPLVSGALEQARDATDQANERAAKAEITLVYMGVADNPASSTYVAGQATGDMKYDAENGVLVAMSETDITGYGKCTKGSNTYCQKDTAAHTDKVLKVSLDANGKFTCSWIDASTTT